jgi:polysaccharide export outer membrane protein
LSRSKVLVRPDGRISIPLVQDQPAAGMTTEAIRQEIEKKLKKYLDTPTYVSVIVEAIHQSYSVFVTGRVPKAGMITSEKPITVMQALSFAGSYLEFAKLSEIVVIRDNTVFRFNYLDVIQGKNLNQNMLLKSGDVVVVP